MLRVLLLAWKAALKGIDSELRINTHDSGVGPSRSYLFLPQGSPCIAFLQQANMLITINQKMIASLLNYEGMYEISEYILALIASLNDQGKLEFSKTKDEQETRTSFKVTLGVMPDYVSAGRWYADRCGSR